MGIITIEKWNNTTGACSIAIIFIFIYILAFKVAIFSQKNLLDSNFCWFLCLTEYTANL